MFLSAFVVNKVDCIFVALCSLYYHAKHRKISYKQNVKWCRLIWASPVRTVWVPFLRPGVSQLWHFFTSGWEF